MGPRSTCQSGSSRSNAPLVKWGAAYGTATKPTPRPNTVARHCASGSLMKIEDFCSASISRPALLRMIRVRARPFSGERMTTPENAASSLGSFGRRFPRRNDGDATATSCIRPNSRATMPGGNSKPPPIAASKPSAIRSNGRLSNVQSGITAG